VDHRVADSSSFGFLVIPGEMQLMNVLGPVTVSFAFFKFAALQLYPTMVTQNGAFLPGF